jgi:hypothetical protein
MSPFPDREMPVYLKSDTPRMFQAIRQAPRPCPAFKILPAGRRYDIEYAFRETFAGIKPGDAVIVGIYDHYSDQAGQNAAVTRRFGSSTQSTLPDPRKNGFCCGKGHKTCRVCACTRITRKTNACANTQPTQSFRNRNRFARCRLSCRCDSTNWHSLQFGGNLWPLGRPLAFLDHHADGAERQTALTEEGFLTTLAFLQFHTTPPCERRHHTRLETDEKPRRWGDG